MRVIRGYRLPEGTSTVLTLGNFDGVHLGHRALFARLRKVGHALNLPTLVLTFEPHPREFFSPKQVPARLSVLREKLEHFADAGVDICCVCRFDATFAALSAQDFIDQVLVDALDVRHIIVGDDFRFGARRVGDFQLLQSAGQTRGFGVEALEPISVTCQRVSSSAVRAALDKGDMVTAEALLGRPYMMDGRVVHGDKIGRSLGFATANLRVKHAPLPLAGVFCVTVRGSSERWHHHFGERALQGVANLGTRPTARGVRTMLEIHLFDFDADIYGEHLSVYFRRRLREEQRFPDFDALKRQIAADIQEARSFFRQSVARSLTQSPHC